MVCQSGRWSSPSHQFILMRFSVQVGWASLVFALRTGANTKFAPMKEYPLHCLPCREEIRSIAEYFHALQKIVDFWQISDNFVPAPEYNTCVVDELAERDEIRTVMLISPSNRLYRKRVCLLYFQARPPYFSFIWGNERCWLLVQPFWLNPQLPNIFSKIQY